MPETLRGVLGAGGRMRPMRRRRGCAGDHGGWWVAGMERLNESLKLPRLSQMPGRNASSCFDQGVEKMAADAFTSGSFRRTIAACLPEAAEIVAAVPRSGW